MTNEKALVVVNGGTSLMESEVIRSAIEFAQQGFAGAPITLPRGYDISRSVKNFCFSLPNVVNIQKATKESIMQAVHDYVTQGLDVSKHQCALIVYGDKLTVQREYFGQKALAMRLRPDVAEISNGIIIYEGDTVEVSYDERGRTFVKHETKFSNWGNGIAGVYVTITFKDGTSDCELMTRAEIDAAHAMSKNGDRVHKQFKAEMSRKTCVTRACKKLINSSDDRGILDDAAEVDFEYMDFDASGISEPVIPAAPYPVKIPTPRPIADTADPDYSITIPYKEYKESYEKSGYKTGTYYQSGPLKGSIVVYLNQFKKGYGPDATVKVDDIPEDITDMFENEDVS